MNATDALRKAREQFGDKNVVTTFSENGIEYVTIYFEGKSNRFDTPKALCKVLD